MPYFSEVKKHFKLIEAVALANNSCVFNLSGHMITSSESAR